MALLRCSLLGLMALANLTRCHPTLTTTATTSITTPDIQTMNLTEDFLSHHFLSSTPTTVEAKSSNFTYATQSVPTDITNVNAASRSNILPSTTATAGHDAHNQLQESEGDQHTRHDSALTKLHQKLAELYLEYDHPAQARNFIHSIEDLDEYVKAVLRMRAFGVDEVEVPPEAINEDGIEAGPEDFFSYILDPPSGIKPIPSKKLHISKKRPPKVSWQDAIITREGIITLQKQVVVDQQRLEDVKNDIKADRLKTLDVLKKEVAYYEGRIAQHGKTIASERAKLEMQEGGVRKA
ncbi:hypothetical protein Slin14017_G091870 [Septoria linicola]|nr:hypothetical protein Slin14017_G091870 [Septoria linicola]